MKRNQDLWVHFSTAKNEVQSTGDWTVWLEADGRSHWRNFAAVVG
ncbi:hypothetical protein OH492_24435 [Vibrio chagasii]|nr:hypothetical protein [Vibrio chagasii]